MTVIYYPTGDPDGIRFGKDAIISAYYHSQADLFFGGMPQAELTVQLRSTTPILPQREEKLELELGGGTQMTGYIKSARRLSQDRYQLVASARYEQLQLDFIGDFYENVPFVTLQTQIAGEVNMGADDAVCSKTITGYLPNSNRLSAIEKLAFASEATLVWSRYGMLRFRSLKNGYTFQIPKGQMLQDMSVRHLPLYTHYEVGAHSYTPGQLEVLLRDHQEYLTSPATITFTTPHYDYWLTDEPCGEIQESGPNFLTLIHQGVVTVYAKPYIHEVHYLTRQGETDGDYIRKMTVRDNTLIQQDNAQSLLSHMQWLGGLRQQLQCKMLVRPGEFAPEPGDCLLVPTLWGSWFRGYVTKTRGELSRDWMQMELTLCGKEEV